MKIYGIIPARSGSQGLPNKNIRDLNGKPLIAYSIAFAQYLGLDRVFCSTDSEAYAVLARDHGAEVPFLRSASAASSTAMEQDILADLYEKFSHHGIEQPDILVWLRPTFVFRSINDVRTCINLLLEDSNLSSARTVCEAESRIYAIKDGLLVPDFDDGGKSMIRRQDVGKRYKVYSTDVIRSHNNYTSADFLGGQVASVVTSKICGLDIDDDLDFALVEALLKYNQQDITRYIDSDYLALSIMS